jgi:hypothetical protein
MKPFCSPSKLPSFVKTMASVSTWIAALSPQLASALPAYPEVAAVTADLSIYKDYDDPKLFYYIPKRARIMKTPQGKPMASHAMFFSRNGKGKAVTQYNLTLEPVLGGRIIEDALSALKKKYGEGAALQPLPVTTMSFSVTDTRGNASGNNSTAVFESAVPNWTGNLHSFHQSFSVQMRGLINETGAEPAMSELMTNPAGNGFIGTLHYGFRGITKPIACEVVVDVHQFASAFKARMSSQIWYVRADVAAAINRARNTMGITHKCRLENEAKPDEMWKVIIEKIIDQGFDENHKAPDVATGHPDGGYLNISASWAEATKETFIRLKMEEERVKDYSGDIDLAAGGMPKSFLDKNIKFVCNAWSVFNREKDACEAVCEESRERWDTATKSCVENML